MITTVVISPLMYRVIFGVVVVCVTALSLLALPFLDGLRRNSPESDSKSPPQLKNSSGLWRPSSTQARVISPKSPASGRGLRQRYGEHFTDEELRLIRLMRYRGHGIGAIHVDEYDWKEER